MFVQEQGLSSETDIGGWLLLAALAQVNSVKVAESLEGPKRAAKDGPKKLWVHSDAQEVVNGLNGTSGIPWSRKAIVETIEFKA